MARAARTRMTNTSTCCRISSRLLARKSTGQMTILAHVGSVVMDNWHGLIVATDVRSPACNAERDAAVELLGTLEPHAARRNVGADNGYDTTEFDRCPHDAPGRVRRGHRGRERAGWIFTFTSAAYDLGRMRTLICAGVCA
jgi:hypothetical protein